MVAAMANWTWPPLAATAKAEGQWRGQKPKGKAGRPMAELQQTQTQFKHCCNLQLATALM